MSIMRKISGFFFNYRIEYYNQKDLYAELKRKYDISHDMLVEERDKSRKLIARCNSLQSEIDNMVKAYDFDSDFDAMLGEDDPEEIP